MGSLNSQTGWARLCPVRKQYHFWPAENGFDAWDVDRLIALSRDLPVERVAVDSITEIDTSYWFDGSAELPTVRKVVEHCKLISDVDISYPIILGHDGRVMDGMHRVARALLDGRSKIEAFGSQRHSSRTIEAACLTSCRTDRARNCAIRQTSGSCALRPPVARAITRSSIGPRVSRAERACVRRRASVRLAEAPLVKAGVPLAAHTGSMASIAPEPSAEVKAVQSAGRERQISDLR